MNDLSDSTQLANSHYGLFNRFRGKIIQHPGLFHETYVEMSPDTPGKVSWP